MIKKPLVYLALSGGVDSSVAADLLLAQGYDVRGVFMKIWSDNDEVAKHGQSEGIDNLEHGDMGHSRGDCPWKEDKHDAMFVASQLGIPFESVNFEKEYKDEVFSYFVHEYKNGRTPNPDILCNEIIKFGVFLEWALKQGADYIATGHHVRRLPTAGKPAVEAKVDPLNAVATKDTSVQLLSGVDIKKDQSYFLGRLNQHQLRHSLFPIGDFTKEEVKDKARALGLGKIADRRSSRGICFIGKVDLKEFLSKYTIEQPGDIVDEDGKVLGQHKGVAFYTIGQRKGLEIPAATPQSKPYFVLAKDAAQNQLIVSDEQGRLFEDKIYCSEAHWLAGQAPPQLEAGSFLTCTAKIRYAQPQQEAEVAIDTTQPDTLVVSFKEPVKSVAPGQFVVFYDGEVVLGSAVIK